MEKGDLSVKLLILGGTVFLGRHLVEAALAGGHEVTLFNRGNHKEASSNVETIIGDRDGDLSALQGRQWDAVIDTCGYVPRIVSKSARALAESVGHYTFISSISAYRDFSLLDFDETAPVGTLEDESVEEVGGETYGPLKALCEKAAEEAMPGRTLVIRPGLIVGPHDPTDRFTYWPQRVAQGGEMLAPGNPDQLVQFIDVRDLAEWTIRMVEARVTGVYHATGPDRKLTFGEFLQGARDALGSDAELRWVDESFLKEKGVGFWVELPLWIPESEGMAGFMAADCTKAIRAGLTFRPLAETVRDTQAWQLTRPADRPWKAGITREREVAVLRAWHESR